MFKVSHYEAFFTSLVVGLAETYFIAFSLHLGVSVVESGLLASLPLVLAGVSPFLFHQIFKKFLLSTWVLIGCAIQCFAVALLALLGVLGSSTSYTFTLLLIIFSIYWFGHFSALPSWNKWIAEIVPHDKSHLFFSKRTRMNQVGIVLGLFLGGIALHLEIFKVSTSFLFILLFLISYHLKFIAFYLFYKLPRSKSYYDLSLSKSLHFFKRQKEFFKSYSLFNFTLYLSAPFVSGYLLSVRGLSYINYMVVMAALFLGKIFTTILLEKSKKSWTPHQLYFWGGLLAAPLPAIWPFCQNAVQLSLLHFVSGIGWAAWEVGISLSFFKKIHENEKLEAVTVYNMVGLPTQVLGTIVSAFLLKNIYNNNYSTMFIIAGICRLIFFLPLYFKRLGEES